MRRKKKVIISNLLTKLLLLTISILSLVMICYFSKMTRTSWIQIRFIIWMCMDKKRRKQTIASLSIDFWNQKMWVKYIGSHQNLSAINKTVNFDVVDLIDFTVSHNGNHLWPTTTNIVSISQILCNMHTSMLYKTCFELITEYAVNDSIYQLTLSL